MDRLKRILVVDDDEKDVKLTLKAMGEANIANAVDTARDGEQALDYLYRRGRFEARDPGNPVVILLDIKMPKIDGIDVLREIRDCPQLKCIPVVMLTSSKEESDLVKSYELGVNAYVVKPVRFKDFIDVVKQIKIFWALVNEPPPYASLSDTDSEIIRSCHS